MRLRASIEPSPVGHVHISKHPGIVPRETTPRELAGRERHRAPDHWVACLIHAPAIDADSTAGRSPARPGNRLHPILDYPHADSLHAESAEATAIVCTCGQLPRHPQPSRSSPRPRTQTPNPAPYSRVAKHDVRVDAHGARKARDPYTAIKSPPREPLPTHRACPRADGYVRARTESRTNPSTRQVVPSTRVAREGRRHGGCGPK